MTTPNVQQLCLEMVEQEMSWFNDGDHWTRLCILRALRSAIVRHGGTECWERYKDETPIVFNICEGCSDHETEYIVPFPCPELQEIAKELEL